MRAATGPTSTGAAPPLSAHAHVAPVRGPMPNQPMPTRMSMPTAWTVGAGGVGNANRPSLQGNGIGNPQATHPYLTAARTNVTQRGGGGGGGIPRM